MLRKRIIGTLAALAVIILSGTSGYMFIEHWHPFDALYMTVITITSVGFMEVHPLSPGGRVFTMLLILCGSGVLIYGISIVTAFIVEGELTDVLRRRKMQKKIDRMAGHIIVCGAGQTGRFVIDELLKTGREFVAIDNDTARVGELLGRDIVCIEGDATHDSVLLAAGIIRARGFISVLHSDAENLFAVITAKRLNPSLRVISKSIEEESIQKIRMVGADSVVMPNLIGGLRIVSEMIRPSVVTFLDVMLRVKDRTIRVEEIEIGPSSPLSGLSLSASGISQVEGVTVVALTDRMQSSYVFNPPATRPLSAGDILIVMGEVERINEIRQRA